MLEKEKLEKIIESYSELQTKMGDPAIVSNQQEYQKLAKEFAKQGPLVNKSERYLKLLNNLSEAKEMLSDADLHDVAQEEISGIEAELPKLEDDIKLMLIPEDPADEKDIIVEIRAAAGGDEAAIFCGDLYKMYERYCTEQS